MNRDAVEPLLAVHVIGVAVLSGCAVIGGSITGVWTGRCDADDSGWVAGLDDIELEVEDREGEEIEGEFELELNLTRYGGDFEGEFAHKELEYVLEFG